MALNGAVTNQLTLDQHCYLSFRRGLHLFGRIDKFYSEHLCDGVEDRGFILVFFVSVQFYTKIKVVMYLANYHRRKVRVTEVVVVEVYCSRY